MDHPSVRRRPIGWLTLTVHYVGRSWSDVLNAMPVPPFTLFDLVLRYQLGSISPTLAKWDIAFNVKNPIDTPRCQQL